MQILTEFNKDPETVSVRQTDHRSYVISVGPGGHSGPGLWRSMFQTQLRTGVCSLNRRTVAKGWGMNLSLVTSDGFNHRNTLYVWVRVPNVDKDDNFAKYLYERDRASAAVKSSGF